MAHGDGYGWSFYNAWAAPILDRISHWQSGWHYTEPGWHVLTYLFFTQLPTILLGLGIAVCKLRQPPGHVPRKGATGR